MKLIRIAILISIVTVITSCKPEKLQWDTGLLVPLLKTSLSINDIVADSLLEENSDNSLSIVYRQNFEVLDLQNLVDIPVINFSKTTTLNNLNLSDKQFKANITLGMIAQDIPMWGPLIISQNGTYMILPDMTEIVSGPHPVNISNFFTEATFVSGYMDITLRNDFPAAVGNLDYKIENTNSGTTFITHSFPYVASGSTETTTIDLAGKTVEGNLDAYLLNLDFLVGNQSVFIDTSEALDITITLRDLVIESATAVFPEQNILDEKVETKLGLESAKLKHVVLDSGTVYLDVISTIQDSIFFNFNMPKAIKNGTSFSVNATIPPAQAGSNTSVSYEYSFDGYELDLTGLSGNKNNIFYTEATGRIDSTGQEITLSQNDSLRILLRIENLKPNYASGFLGNYEQKVGPKEVDFKIFRNIISGGINFENVITSLSIENSVGITGKLKVDKLEAINNNSQNTINLISSELSSPVVINKPVSPHNPTYTNFVLDNQNSNITDLIEVTPNKLSYDFTLQINPNVDSNSSDYQDYIFSSSKVSSSIDVEMPLSFVANSLILRDTIELSEETKIEFENVESGELNFIVDNGFPLSSSIEIHFIDKLSNTALMLQPDNTIDEAPIVDGRVSNPKRSVLTFPISSEDINQITNSTDLLIVSQFDSKNSDYVKIYSDYSLKTTLSGRFKYNINQ